MNENIKLCLGIIMILVGSLVIQDKAWEDKATWMVNFAENQAGARLRTELYREYEDRLSPPVFNISTNGCLTVVGLYGTDVVLFQSISAAQAIQWAIDNIPDHTSIAITETIIMDGQVNMFSGIDGKSYALMAEGGYLDYTRTRASENITGPWCMHHDPYHEYFVNEHVVGIITYDSIFTNCTIDNSTLYHCEIIESNVTNTFIYASLFEYKYGVRYVDYSDGRKSYNVTSWWKNP